MENKLGKDIKGVEEVFYSDILVLECQQDSSMEMFSRVEPSGRLKYTLF